MTITHQSTDDLRDKLREKLQKLSIPMKVVRDAVVIDGEFMDIDAELGLKDEKQPVDASRDEKQPVDESDNG